jgi:hypothetical protein
MRRAPDLKLLLEILDQGYDKKAWHGPTLRQSLRGVSAVDAAWRPAPGRHNIWEIAVHAAYWKYVIRRKLCGEPRGTFALKGSNWFPRPEEMPPAEKAWKADLRILEEEHRRLRVALASASPAKLIPARFLFGAAFHDIYHAGQIRLLRRLRKNG